MGDGREWKVRCGPRTNGEWVLDHAPPAPERGEQGVILVERAARDSAEAKYRTAESEHAEASRAYVKAAGERTEARAQRDRLAVALREYGQHAEFCTFAWGHVQRPCNCGLSAALSVLDREKPDDRPAIDDALADLEAFIRAERVGAWPWVERLAVCDGVLARVARMRATNGP